MAKNWCNFFLKYVVKFTSEISWACCFLFYRFFIVVLIYLIDIGLLI